MTIELLISAIVRQTTILIAQLATSGGARAPLTQVANQVFLDLVRELERQGVSRKVSADMFGLGLRTYQRKIQRLVESSTQRGRSLWVAVLQFLESRSSATRAEVLMQFAGDDETLVRSVLHDLCETGLAKARGSGAATRYSATPSEELMRPGQSKKEDGLDELLWALIYREGPVSLAALARRCGGGEEIGPALQRLLEVGRVSRTEDELFRAESLVLPLGSPVGWEASVFDHFEALVSTVLCRLRVDRERTDMLDQIGGSTYTVEVWPGHPLQEEAVSTLSEVRAKVGELRERIEAYNREHLVPEDHTKMLFYVGQCLIPQGNGDPQEQD